MVHNINYINILKAKTRELVKISKDNLLALNLEEMKAIQNYFRKKGRNPTDIEIETIAQTWSEHCKHKTLTGIIEYIEYDDKNRIKYKKIYNNLLKETIFRVTKELNKKWCVSVFKDNAGIIEFDRNYCIAFKVETHNHPSAIEPYGGAGTGIGGVIRDILGVGLGAKPILNTDVFCFGPLDLKYSRLPEGVLHPKRIFKGVISGVRDYGNRMGIPTANGAVIFDESYICNPLVYCGTLGIIPRNKCFKKVSPGDIIVAVGGRTGRDGIHGATFSSLELDKDTPLSPVQIGNPIVEKKVLDTILQARDRNLYTALTDCGAGGFSSAIGELGQECGARVYIDRAPLKYKGLLPWEIWLSEAQERMVLAVPEKNLKELIEIFESEDVETTVLGEFTDTGKLEVYYHKNLICDLDMEFLHKGVPKLKKVAVWRCIRQKELPLKKVKASSYRNLSEVIKKVLASPDVASKEWIIRQYDHEVQGHTVIKPLTGILSDGPSDGCVLFPYTLKGSKNHRCIAVACGINPLYSRIDPYWMSASAIDEALRNIISLGGDLNRTALLDNFCWGNCNRNEQLAGIVRAAQACYDIAKVYGVPFISGKDSLNNEFRMKNNKRISVLPTLLISAVAIIEDIRKVVTMDFKKPGNFIYLVGETFNELGGSQFYKVHGIEGGNVPKVNASKGKKLMVSLSSAIKYGLVSSCHDISDGGLSVAVSEMAFSGGYGAVIDLSKIGIDEKLEEEEKNIVLLFSESNSRFIVEVHSKFSDEFEKLFKGQNIYKIGYVLDTQELIIKGINGKKLIQEDIYSLKKAWQSTLSFK